MPEDLLDLDFPTAPPPTDLAERARRRSRRRRTVLGGGSALAVGAVVTVAVAVAPPGPERHPVTRLDVVADPGPSPVVRSAPEVATPEPETFIAFTPAGAERPTLVRTDTGATVRVLGPGAQVVGHQSPDRSTLWIPVTHDGVDADGCARQWNAVDVPSGTTHVDAALTGLAAFEASPDGTRVATVGSCTTGATGLTVRDLSTGQERSADIGPGNWFVEAWGPQGSTILVSNQETATTYSLYDASTLKQVASMPSLPAGCVAGAATLRTDTDLVVAETCADGTQHRVDLVDVDLTTGAELRRVPVVTGDYGPVYNDISVDRSGQHAIFSVDHTASSTGDEVWIVTGDTARKQGLVGVYGVLW